MKMLLPNVGADQYPKIQSASHHPGKRKTKLASRKNDANALVSTLWTKGLRVSIQKATAEIDMVNTKLTTASVDTFHDHFMVAHSRPV